MIKITGSKKSGFVVESDNLQELTSWAVKESEPYWRSSQDEPEQSWDLGAGFKGMQKLVKSGWHVGTEEIAAKLKDLRHRVEEEPAGYFNAVVGQFFDIGLVLSGEPECWFEQAFEEKRKVVKVAVQTLASCAIPADLIKNRGAAVVALVEKLQAEGFIVELEVIIYAGSSDRYSLGNCPFITVKLNLGCSPIDIDTAAFCLAHPAFTRRLGFAIFEAVIKGDCGTYGSGRAGVSDYKDDTADVLLGRFINISYPEISQFTTLEGSARWVREQVEAIVAGGNKEKEAA